MRHRPFASGVTHLMYVGDDAPAASAPSTPGMTIFRLAAAATGAYAAISGKWQGKKITTEMRFLSGAIGAYFGIKAIGAGAFTA